MIIEAKGITKSFGPLEVLKGVDFSADKGEVVSIMGASGAGKSTLLQILGTLSTPDRGSLTIDGHDISGMSSDSLSAFRCKHIGFVFQAHHLLPEFTAAENVMIPMMIAGKSRSEASARATELLKLVGLEQRTGHKPSELSGGEQQRVSIARAIANAPSVLFADEPTGNLDSATKGEIHKLFFELREKLGQTIIIVTHDPELSALCDRSLRMKDGQFIWMEPFRFKQFEVRQDKSALKLGTDAVLLGASMTIKGDEREMLDIGTGTGVIALMAAQRRSGYPGDFRITGIDIDGPSAEEAAENFTASPWSETLESRHCALKDFRSDGKFDLIFSNPPYYDSSLENPDARLAGARHTNSLPRQALMAFASENLAEGGRFSIILPSDEEKATLRLAASFGLRPFRLIRFRTTPAKAAKRSVMEFSTERSEYLEETLVIGADTETMTAPFYL